MSDEKPLHVRVAEALGCKTDLAKDGQDYCRCEGGIARHGDAEWGGLLLRYDTDWSATGPLIEKYEVTLSAPLESWKIRPWEAYIKPDDSHILGEGLTPLIAVCNLILALAAAGKLPK